MSLDGDFQTWNYRTDLFNDDTEKKAFSDKFGYELAPPRTWKQHSDIAGLLPTSGQGLFGSTDLRNQGWGYTNWYQRFVSMGNPNQFLFDETGKALDQFRCRLCGHRGICRFAGPSFAGCDFLGLAGTIRQFCQCRRRHDLRLLQPAEIPRQCRPMTGSKVTGKIGSMLPPGREVDGGLISRTVLWLNLSASVSSQSKHPEACYLLLQWLGSSRIYSWMTANPGGYFDPFQLANFADPLVRETYHDYHMDIVRESVARTVPTINYPGATAFHNALDENLVAALTKSKTAEQAMADTEREWGRIARRIGEEKLISAIKANKAAWPTIIDAV